MKKIAFFIGGMGWGGAEKVISILADSFAKRGYDTTIITLLNKNNVFQLDSRIKILSFVREKKNRYLNIIFWIKKIKDFLKAEKPDIVVSFVCRINLLVIISKMLSHLKFRLVISERNDPRFDGRGKISTFMAKNIYKNADLLICQTKKQMSFFPKNVQSKTVIIKNPVEIKVPIINFENKKDIIINAARYDKSKNQILLLRAFEKIVLQGKNRGFSLYFYGSGPQKKVLEKYVSDNKLDRYVCINESITNIQEKISEASIFCLSSNYEGMSNALMEALLLGTAPISTDVSGAEDLIMDGKNGFIVPVGEENLLYEKLLFLIESKDCRKKFYDFNTSVVFQKQFDKSIEEYIKCIENDF